MAYDLARVKKEFIEVCLKADVHCVLDVPIKLNGRLTRTLGRVIQEYDEMENCYLSTSVEFSKSLLETATDNSIHNVIMHEAAHFIVTARTGECHGHDAYFKAVCAEIGATANKSQTKIERTVEKEEQYKYTILCPHCNKPVAFYSRRCKAINNIENYICKRCGQGGLQVIQNW